MKRTALKRGSMAWLRAPRKPLPAVSARRRAEKPQRDAVRAAVLERDHHRCQGRYVLPHVECRLPLDVHEVIPRSAWPEGYLVAANAVTICRAHHEYVTDHPAEAHARGLHGYSWERPAWDPYPGSRP